MNQLPNPACGREPLVEAIAAFLRHDHGLSPVDIRAAVEEAIAGAGPDAIAGLGQRLAIAGTDWSYTPRDPLARGIHRALASRVLQHEPVIRGVEHLERVAGRAVVIVANHLSYSDANAIEVLLDRAGAGALADRLTVIAGPKVYSNVRRRFSSLCFGTIKVPQSSGLSSEEAVMNPREVAAAARQSIDVAHERLRLGEALLVFPEGTRSRTGRMQRLLSGAARYLDGPDTWVLPMALTGTERLFPMSEEGLTPVVIELGIGEPMPAVALLERAAGDRQKAMDLLGRAIAELLPDAYRGVYGSSWSG